MNSISTESLDRLFRSARSHNSWSDTPVQDEDIQAIYDLFKWGPTSLNCMPARFVWVRSQEAKARLAALASGSNAQKILAAPVTVLIGRDSEYYERLPELFPHAPFMYEMLRDNVALREATARRNTTLQGAYLMMAARALGFDCGPMSGFDEDGVNKAFFGDTSIEVDFICSIGHGADKNPFQRLPRLNFENANIIV